MRGKEICQSYFMEILIFLNSRFSAQFLPGRRLPSSSITKGRLCVFSLSLLEYHSKVKERFKFRGPHDLLSQRVIFLSLRSGRQKPLRDDEEETLSLCSRVGPEARAPVWFSGSEERSVASWRTEGPPAIYRGPLALSPFFTFALLAIIIRVLWLRGLNGTEPLAPI